MKSSIRTVLLSGSAFSLLLGLGQAAQAQAPAEAASPALAEVVVTAQKRAENLQTTPVAVTAVNQEALQRQGVKDITDLQRVAPEVAVQSGVFNVVQIRGLRIGTFAPTVDNPNAVHVDGAYLARYTGLNGFFYDLERVEVLAGPQGTLYGRNSVGGTINVITHKPDRENGGFISIDVGNYQTVNLQAAANWAPTDSFAVRLSAMSNSHEGYITDSGQNAQDLKGYRLSARYEPTSNDRILVSADYEHIGGPPTQSNTIVNVLKSPTVFTVTGAGGTAAQQANGPIGSVALGACPAGQTCTSTVVAINATDDPWHNSVIAGDNDRDLQDTSASGFNVQWDHDFGFATLTSQASYRTTETENEYGYTKGLRQDVRLMAAGVFSPSVGISGFSSEWNSQEIRLSSNDSFQKTYQYTAGLYRFHEHSHDNYGPVTSLAAWFTNNNAATRPGAGLGNLVIAQGNVQPSYLPFRAGVWRPSINDSKLADTDAYSVFGQLVYSPPPLPNLHLMAGARYNWETKTASLSTWLAPTTPNAQCPAVNLPYCGAVLPASSVAQFTNESKDFEQATYKLNVAYEITPKNMLYATWATGFVSGGYALGFPPNGDITPPLDHSYKPGLLESWEIGSKNRFFDDRLQVNLSAFFYDYQNYLNTQQVRYVDPSNLLQGVSNYIASVNAAGTEMKGVNLDAAWLVTQNDQLSMNAQYLEATIAFDLADFYLGTANGDLNLLRNTLFPTNLYPDDYQREGTLGRPEWTVNVSYQHTFDFSENGTLDAQLDMRYVSAPTYATGAPQAAIVANANYVQVPARTTFDFSARYRPQEGRWSVSAYVRNLTNKKYLTARGLTTNVNGNPTQIDPANPASLAPYLFAYQTGQYGDPRTFGATLRMDF